MLLPIPPRALVLGLGVWAAVACTPGDPGPEPQRKAAPVAAAARPVPVPVPAPGPAPAPPSPSAREALDWNDAQIGWRSYADGVTAARAQHKPICLVFFATWCPHCKNFSKVFHDPRVVARSKSFVMVRQDSDQDSALSSRYAPDGEYIPRTLFLSSDGKLDTSVAAPRATYKYFYDEHDPASLLDGMQRALARLP